MPAKISVAVEKANWMVCAQFRWIGFRWFVPGISSSRLPAAWCMYVHPCLHSKTSWVCLHSLNKWFVCPWLIFVLIRRTISRWKWYRWSSSNLYWTAVTGLVNTSELCQHIFVWLIKAVFFFPVKHVPELCWEKNSSSSLSVCTIRAQCQEGRPKLQKTRQMQARLWDKRGQQLNGSYLNKAVEEQGNDLSIRILREYEVRIIRAVLWLVVKMRVKPFAEAF